MKEQQARFHITITDKETGDVIVDTDTCAIIGAIDQGEGTRQLGLTACNSVELAATATAAAVISRKCIDDLPEHLKKFAVKLIKKYKKN